MMKRITSLFTMLLFFVVGAFAQEDFGLKTVSVGPALANFETDTWYFLHQARGGGDGVHSVVGELPTSGGFAWDTGTQSSESVSNKVYKYSLGDIEDEELANGLRMMLIRFVESPNEEGAYLLQFANGHYWTAPSGNQSTILATTDNKYDAWDFNVYLINGEEGHIGINQWNMQSRLDNNGAGNSIVFWGTGEIETTDGNNDWAIHEVIWSETSAYEAALQELIAALNAYDPYTTGGDQALVPGTLPGQYDPAAVEAFNKAVDEAYEAEDNADLSAEELKALAQAIIDTYKAVIATRVYYVPESGYYFITSTLDWTETVTVTGEDGEEESDILHTTKAIYADGNNVNWKTIDRESCTFLWKLEPGTAPNSFALTNMAVDKGVNTVATSAAVTFTDGPVDMMFDVVESDESNEKEIDKYVLGIRRADQAAGTSLYLHCGGHSGGAGKSGNIVGWNAGVGASRWVLEPVSDEAAAELIASYEIFKNHDQLVSQYEEMVADAAAKIEVAKDISVKLDEENPLVTDASQFSSPYTTTDQQCDDIETVYTYLLDGDVATYWHSSWEAGSVEGGTHYLQVEMPDTEVSNAAIRFTRRNVANDHITLWGVYGLDEDNEEIEKDGCELLAELKTPWASNTETVTSGAFPTNGHKYIRFYINNTVGSGINATRGYGHVSEFQVYPAEIIQPTPNQYAVLGDIVKNLEAVLEAQADIDVRELTADQFAAMKTAYDAFIAKFVDPTALRNKMTQVAPLAKGVKIGKNPGEWASNDCATALQNALAAAEAYDKSADYTPAKSEEHIAALDAAAEGVPAAANKVQTGKWYRIHLATEAEYEANGWGKANMEESYNEETGVRHPELFGKYLSVAIREASEGGIYDILNISTDEVTVGNNLFFQNKDVDIEDADQAMWRFIAVGDTAYILQNKATGMFLRTAGTSGATQLSVHPSLFNTKAIGYGQNIIMGTALDGTSHNNLHAQRDHNILVTWSAADAGSNSGLYIEEAEDVAADYAGTDFRLPLTMGKIATYCYPVEVSCAEKDVVLYAAALNGTEVTLQPLKGNKAESGQPFVLIYGTTEDYDAEAEADIVKLNHGYNLVSEPLTVGALHGVFAETTIGAGKIVAEANTLVVSKKTATKAAANSAYIADEEAIDAEATITLVISAGEYDSIDSMISNVNKNGNIYTLDGRMAGKGNLNAVKNLGRGIYILNGVKIAVK